MRVVAVIVVAIGECSDVKVVVIMIIVVPGSSNDSNNFHKS